MNGLGNCRGIKVIFEVYGYEFKWDLERKGVYMWFWIYCVKVIYIGLLFVLYSYWDN